jgi:hypothetical protein
MEENAFVFLPVELGKNVGRLYGERMVSNQVCFLGKYLVVLPVLLANDESCSVETD